MGPWTKSRVRGFLAEARIPMRLAANTDSGFPIVLSLWFLTEEDDLLDRYLGSSDSNLGRFLLARAEGELQWRSAPPVFA